MFTLVTSSEQPDQVRSEARAKEQRARRNFITLFICSSNTSEPWNKTIGQRDMEQNDTVGPMNG